MSQPPNDRPDQPGNSADQPTHGSSYGQPPAGDSAGQQYGDSQQYGPPPTQPYGQQQYGQAGWSQPSAAQYGSDIRQSEAGYAHLYGQKPRTGMAVAALVLGILAIILAWFPIGSYIAVVLALLALIFGIIGVRRQAGKGMAITGIVLGSIGIIASIAMSVVWTIGFIAVSECIDETGASQGPAFEACINRKANNF